MKILVTGAAGFIGSHLAERFAKLDHEVIGLDSLLNNYDKRLKDSNIQQLQDQNVSVVIIDLTNENVTDFTKDIDFVFHLAAQPGIDSTVSFEQYEQNNVIATKNLLDAVKKNKALKGFINISTSSVYGSNATRNELSEPKPISYYGITKLAAEQLVMSESRNGNIRACSLRLYSVYGPRERPEKLYHKLIKSILFNDDFSIYKDSKSHIRSYTYIDDIIDGIVAAYNNFSKCDGEIFNIGTDHSITTGEGISIVEKVMGKKANLMIIPRRHGDQLVTIANIKKAKNILNYNPKIVPEEGLLHQIAWCKKLYGF